MRSFVRSFVRRWQRGSQGGVCYLVVPVWLFGGFSLWSATSRTLRLFVLFFLLEVWKSGRRAAVLFLAMKTESK